MAALRSEADSAEKAQHEQVVAALRREAESAQQAQHEQVVAALRSEAESAQKAQHEQVVAALRSEADSAQQELKMMKGQLSRNAAAHMSTVQVLPLDSIVCLNPDSTSSIALRRHAASACLDCHCSTHDCTHCSNTTMLTFQSSSHTTSQEYCQPIILH